MSNKKKIIYFGCWLLLAILVSGCDKKNAEDEDWKDEVMMAHECGLEGFSCCADKEPACQYGLECCTDQNDIRRNMCAENCACGSLDRFCCKNEPQCDAGLACSGSRCVACGDKDQPCCAGGCTGDLVCAGDKCVLCGFSGHPCCDKEPSCINQEISDPDRTECRDNICAPCGFGGQAACLSEPACGDKHLLNNSLCYKCGDFNQPCCDADRCDAAENLECRLGFCIKK